MAVNMALIDKYKLLGGFGANLEMKIGARGHNVFSGCFRKLVFV